MTGFAIRAVPTPPVQRSLRSRLLASCATTTVAVLLAAAPSLAMAQSSGQTCNANSYCYAYSIGANGPNGATAKPLEGGNPGGAGGSANDVPLLLTNPATFSGIAALQLAFPAISVAADGGKGGDGSNANGGSSGTAGGRGGAGGSGGNVILSTAPGVQAKGPLPSNAVPILALSLTSIGGAGGTPATAASPTPYTRALALPAGTAGRSRRP